jgi:uncharacterized circularly permuted ATP-grasp superfamily protein/uncharacterized alpha-E superfamily protein
VIQTAPEAPAFERTKMSSAGPEQDRCTQEFIAGRLRNLKPAELRTLGDRMEATLREMGVTFDVIRNDPWGQQPWMCDILPHVFSVEEWKRVRLGFCQRLRAFELFLQDIYGAKEILRQGVVPIYPVLGSPHYIAASLGLPRPGGAYLHLSGICLTRTVRGDFAVKHHHFSQAGGISYMMQNRRALARVAPELFDDCNVRSLADAPLAIIEKLRGLGFRDGGEPMVVLLSPGPASPVYSEHSLLARRMGIPLVQGGDLLVLDDCVYLKTVRGLERVEVIYNRVSDAWLDPLVFRRDSRIGVPGLVHCLRKGTVTLINPSGSQLSDDRTLLCFASRIVRFYLAEEAILPTVPTHWLGDIDQRELVLSDMDQWDVRSVAGDETIKVLGAEGVVDRATLLQDIRKNPRHYIAQPRGADGETTCFVDGKEVSRQQDHVIFAVRSGEHYDVLPGALTRVHPKERTLANAADWSSKDTWVLWDADEESYLSPAPAKVEVRGPMHQITSRVAEAFYWIGRYLERAYQQAYLIQVVETFETEELNSAERKLYRPMWSRLLPPLEQSSKDTRRSIANREERYRLVVQEEPGSVVSTFLRALRNAESVQEGISPEAWATLQEIRSLFLRHKFRENTPAIEQGRISRRLSDAVTRLVPQFFAVAQISMLADDAWRFLEIGQLLERAVITANSVLAISSSLSRRGKDGLAPLHASEIELSAFLRLLGTRDAYRRVYQTRAEPGYILEMLFQNPESTRSISYCLNRCSALLRESLPASSPATMNVLEAICVLLARIRRIRWEDLIGPAPDEDALKPDAASAARALESSALTSTLAELLRSTSDIHNYIADGFLNHQTHIAQATQPMLKGFSHAV